MKHYKINFTTDLEPVTKYITEEEYFDYYQNACDPTFENFTRDSYYVSWDIDNDNES